MSSSRKVRILSSCRIPHEFPFAQPLLLRESLGSLLKRLRALAEHRKHSLDHGLITSITQWSKCSASSNSTWMPGVLSPSRTTDVSGDRQGWHVSRYSATVPRFRCSFTPSNVRYRSYANQRQRIVLQFDLPRTNTLGRVRAFTLYHCGTRFVRPGTGEAFGAGLARWVGTYGLPTSTPGPEIGVQ